MRLIAARRPAGDDGVVAVVVALLTVVLFGAAAVAVDLGSAFQRRRATQTTADLAALAGAQDLPQPVAACRAAVRYLLDNPPDGDGFALTESMCTAAGDTPDGTVDVSADATTIEVSVPERTVEFGFAGVLGFSSTTVDAQATAAIRSPATSIPYYLPVDSATGLLCLKDTAPGQTRSIAMRHALLAAPPVAATTITSVAPMPFEGPVGTAVTLRGTDLDSIVRLTFGDADAGFTVAANRKSIVATAPPGTGDVTVIGYTRADKTGTAYAAPYQFRYTTTAPSPSPSTSPAAAPGPVVDDCAGSTGQFGYLDIPRADGSSVGEQIELNIIKGVDHAISTFPTASLPPAGSQCANDSGLFPVVGAVPDRGPGVPGANCLKTQTGNALPNSTRGFLDGVGGLDGRLEGVGSTATVATRGGVNVDEFASYLRGGATVSDFVGEAASAAVAALPTGSIDRSILASPRFAVVPVLSVPSVGATSGYYPVVTLHGVFVDSAPSAPAHGFVTSGGGAQVSAIHAFAFPLRLLPGLLSSSEVDSTVSYIGSGPVIPVLVE